ncbi:sulfatase-like hydrolase/transferase [uncultured Mailhella sp.]|uniref:sulfatase-like hydrolase/transferase n=1 Tax=uncultured Mailhella sp. TaxID=1981031 RepID=UPI002602EC44|nr:sulfatase-like hydrolase/transferase [uncultured Mailhella sp.]
MKFVIPKKADWRFPIAVFLLAVSVFFLVHALWFVQTPVWFPVRCFLNGLPVTLFLFLPALFWKRLARIWLPSVTVLLLVPALLAGMHLFYYETTISQQSLYAIFESNLSESLEFLGSQFSVTALLYALALFTIPLVLLRRALRLIRTSGFSAARFCGVVLLAVFFALYGSGKLPRLAKDNLAWQLVSSWQNYRETMEDLEGYMKKAAGLRAPDVATGREPVTLVVLIGESSSRHHWGLYGYFRDTTPELAAMQDELFVFDDAISPFGRTTLSVAAALSCRDVPGVGELPLVNVFRQAGFEAVWISNQTTIDDTNMIVRLVTGADRKIYLNRGGDQGYIRQFDDKILPALDSVLAQDSPAGRRVVFVHTMGSHVNYASRYPEAFSRFISGGDIQEKPWFTGSAKKYINHYDNSIVYTDHIIAAVIKRLRTVPNSALLFFSDHGEEVYDTRKHHGHHDSMESRYYVDIPFLFWLSPSYRARLTPEEVRRFLAARHRPFVNDAAPYVMLELCGVSFPSPHWKDSPLSSDFAPRPRIIHGVDYDSRYPAEREKASACVR